MNEHARGVQECRVGHRADLWQAGSPALRPGWRSRDKRIFMVKSSKTPFSVIPAEAGIQSF